MSGFKIIERKWLLGGRFSFPSLSSSLHPFFTFCYPSRFCREIEGRK
jgi:hypothetical protein